MRPLEFVDFSVQSATTFTRPVPRRELAAEKIAEQLLQVFSPSLEFEDILLTHDDDLFDYELSVSLFNGAADVTFTPKTLRTEFRNGKDSTGMRLMARSVVELQKIFGFNETERNQLTLYAHATFKKEEDKLWFNEKWKAIGEDSFGGGSSNFVHCKALKGRLIFKTETSLALDSGLFVGATFDFTEAITDKLIEAMQTEFNRLASINDLEFNYQR